MRMRRTPTRLLGNEQYLWKKEKTALLERATDFFFLHQARIKAIFVNLLTAATRNDGKEHKLWSLMVDIPVTAPSLPDVVV